MFVSQMQSAFCLISVAGLIAVGYKCYIFYRNNEDKIDMVRNVLFSSGAVKAEAFAAAPYGKYATITYDRIGTKSTITVPYNRTATVSMSQYKAFLHLENGGQVDITQQPGIPYLSTPRSLGGNAITLLNTLTCMTHTYHADIAPMYGQEIASDE